MFLKVSKKKNMSPAAPVFVVNRVLCLRRFLLRAADAVVPSYLAIYDRFMGAAMTSLVRSAASLGIADLLLSGPLDSAELAKRTGTSQDALERTLRALVAINVFRRLSDGRFANNKVSLGLVKGDLGNVRGFAQFFGMEPVVRAWTNLPSTLQDGATAFNRVNSQTVWDWMDAEPDVRAAFVEGMSSMTEVVAQSIAVSYPFNKMNKICDVGGGAGIVLAAILMRHPHMHGILFDSESMLSEAKSYLSAYGVFDRVELTAGNFFESIPRGADAYILKTVLHNWDDQQALNILGNCRAAMDPGQRLLVSDFLNECESISTLVPFMDMAGMMIYSGRERTSDAMAHLFSKSGFRLIRVIPVPACQAIFEGIAVD
jgi:ubiquinone/menaquinone biosynthesis C-methylase UbiE